jgi:hypothetical protein
MRRLRGGIPRALGNHRSRMAIQYRRYCLATVARYGPLPADAARWLKEAGLLTLSLDQLHADVESARAVLTNGAGRRAREMARVQLRQFERRGSRLRASLEAAEKRLEALVTGQGQDLARSMEMNAALRLEADLLRVAPRT